MKKITLILLTTKFYLNFSSENTVEKKLFTNQLISQATTDLQRLNFNLNTYPKFSAYSWKELIIKRGIVYGVQVVNSPDEIELFELKSFFQAKLNSNKYLIKESTQSLRLFYVNREKFDFISQNLIHLNLENLEEILINCSYFNTFHALNSSLYLYDKNQDAIRSFQCFCAYKYIFSISAIKENNLQLMIETYTNLKKIITIFKHNDLSTTNLEKAHDLLEIQIQANKDFTPIT